MYTHKVRVSMQLERIENVPRVLLGSETQPLTTVPLCADVITGCWQRLVDINCCKDLLWSLESQKFQDEVRRVRISAWFSCLLYMQVGASTLSLTLTYIKIALISHIVIMNQAFYHLLLLGYEPGAGHLSFLANYTSNIATINRLSQFAHSADRSNSAPKLITER